MKIIDALLQLDLYTLRFLNDKIQSPLLDQFFLTITQLHKNIWGPIVAVPLLGLLIYKYRLKSLRVLAALAIVIAAADLFSYRVIKSVVERPRPFENPQTQQWLRKIGQAHGPSFPSNHAANCFAGACVLSWYFRRRRLYFYSFAAAVAVSRVFLGLHYPSDVLAGSLLGWGVGMLAIIFIFNRVSWFWLADRKLDQDPEEWNWRSKSRRLNSN
ncbi:MAG: phosphatase PAP2 family protein [Bdellovibrionales bacterium]